MMKENTINKEELRKSLECWKADPICDFSYYAETDAEIQLCDRYQRFFYFIKEKQREKEELAAAKEMSLSLSDYRDYRSAQRSAQMSRSMAQDGAKHYFNICFPERFSFNNDNRHEINQIVNNIIDASIAEMTAFLLKKKGENQRNRPFI